MGMEGEIHVEALGMRASGMTISGVGDHGSWIVVLAKSEVVDQV
jgi:hypothetical protein